MGNDFSEGMGFPTGAMQMLGVQIEVLLAQHFECM